MLEIFLSSVGIASLAAGRFAVFAATIGSAAFIKWIPAVLALLAIPLTGLRGAARALVAVIIVVVLLNVLYLIWMPALFAAYWSSVAHALFSFFRAEAVYGRQVHPSLLSFLMSVTSTTTGRSWPGLVLYGAAAAFVAFDLIRVTRQSRETAPLLPLWGLGLLFLMPRMKPYGFGIGLVPLYLGALSLPPLPQVLLVLVSCIVPLAAVPFWTAASRLPPRIASSTRWRAHTSYSAWRRGAIASRGYTAAKWRKHARENRIRRSQ